MDRNWVKNETSQNLIFPSSIDAPSLGGCFQVTFSPFDLIRLSELRGDKIGQHPFGCSSFSIERSDLGGDNSIVLSMIGR